MECDMTNSQQNKQHAMPPPQMPPPNPMVQMPPPQYPGVMPPPQVVPQQQPENPYGRLINCEIEKKIGRGQFSVVYRARCKTNSQIVALKKVQVKHHCTGGIYFYNAACDVYLYIFF